MATDYGVSSRAIVDSTKHRLQLVVRLLNGRWLTLDLLVPIVELFTMLSYAVRSATTMALLLMLPDWRSICRAWLPIHGFSRAANALHLVVKWATPDEPNAWDAYNFW